MKISNLNKLQKQQQAATTTKENPEQDKEFNLLFL
jgi:hypothetical protein